MSLPSTREQSRNSLTDRRKSIMNAAINRRSFIIIGATTIVYTLAQLPYLYFAFEVYNIIDTMKGLTLVRYTRFSMVIMQSSCFVNPIIYCATNRGFREFTIQSVYRLLGKPIDIERRCSPPNLSRINYSMAEPIRLRPNHSCVSPKQERSPNVIFNVRAPYYGCNNLNIPRNGVNRSSTGSIYSTNDIYEKSKYHEDMNGHSEDNGCSPNDDHMNGSLLEHKTKDESD